MTERKNVLLLKSPFKGIGALIKWMERDSAEFNLLELKYKGNVELSRFAYSYDNSYAPEDFSLGRPSTHKSSVISLRLSDVIDDLSVYDHTFEKSGDRVTLSSGKGCENQTSIEKIVQLIVDNIDVVLPVFSGDMGGAGFSISMGYLDAFFHRIREDIKPKLYVESKPVQDFLPKNVLECCGVSCCKNLYWS